MTAVILLISSAAIIFILCAYIIILRKRIVTLASLRKSEQDGFESQVKERTRNLEMIRDRLSEYALQKNDLAHELESSNLEISRQKDNLYKQSEKLREAYEEIKKLEAHRQQMTRMIVHDLKNPLNIILNISDSGLDFPRSGHLIKKVSMGMLNLIINILEVNKLENLRIKINPVCLNVREIVERLIEKYAFLIAGIHVTPMVNENICINADLQLTERIFDNLLSNSLKNTTTGGSISVTAETAGGMVTISVKDTGCGIPKKIIDEVFNEFVQGENRSFAYTGSSGIGLAYCKLAVEAQGGKIGLSSTEGEGTHIWFTLPEYVRQNVADMNIIPDAKPEIDEIKGLTPDDIRLISKITSELKRLEIHKLSEILKALESEEFSANTRISAWKDDILRSAFQGDNDMYVKLLEKADQKVS